MKVLELSKLKILFLCLAADGKFRRKDRMSAFNSFGKYFKGFAAGKGKIRRECLALLKPCGKKKDKTRFALTMNLLRLTVYDPDLCLETVKKAILETVEEAGDVNVFDESEYNFRLYQEPAPSQLKCLWCLCVFNEMFDIPSFSGLIDSLAEKWNVNNSLVSEMSRAARNDASLSAYLDWKRNHSTSKAEDSIFEVGFDDTFSKEEFEAAGDKTLLNWLLANIVGLGVFFVFRLRVLLFKLKMFFSINENFAHFCHLREVGRLFKNNISRWKPQRGYATSPVFAKSAFLFLLCDGNATEEKYAAFDGLGKSLPDFVKIRGEAVKSAIQIFGKNMETLDTEQRLKKVETELSSVAESEMSSWGEPSSSQLFFVWYLALLTFYFDKPSQPKTGLLKMFAKKWEITDDVLSEMCDTAETFGTIRERRARLVSQKKNARQLIELHKNWRELNQSILFLINEKKKSDDDKVISENDNAYDDDDDDD
jgi:hypothetical protein